MVVPIHLLSVMRKMRQYPRSWTEWTQFAAGALSSGLLLLYLVANERQMAETAEVERMLSQSLIIYQSVYRQLDGIRATLLTARIAMHANGRCDAVCRAALFQGLKRSMPGVRALLETDGKGVIILGDDTEGDYKLDDHHYVHEIAHMCSGSTLYFSDPYEYQPGTFNLKVSMRRDVRDGCEGSVITIILNPEYFDAVMRSAVYAADMYVAITDTDGHHLVYVPPDPAKLRLRPNRIDRFLELHLRSGRPVSVLRGPGPDGVERLQVQRTMALDDLNLNKHLVIGLSRTIAAVDAGWMRLALIGGVAWLAFWGACGVALCLAKRRRNLLRTVQQRAEEERVAAAERMEMALHGADLGLWDWSVDDDVCLLDARGCAMLGYTLQDQEREPLPWTASIHPVDRAAVLEDLAGHIRGETATFEAEFRMRRQDDTWIWVHASGKAVSRDAKGRALRILGTHSNISARKQAEAEVAHLAFYDGLTNLPNRRLLQDRLRLAIAKAEGGCNHGAVLFVDLDNFKSLNDTLGHETGDRLLQMVALRLQQVTCEADTVARLGGDEFVILLEDLGETPADSASHAELIARKVINTLGLSFTIDGQELRSTPSIGIVMFGSDHHTISDLLRHADMAMYEAKAAGRATFRFFDPAMKAALDSNASLESELRLAVTRGQLRLYYQPVVNTHGTIVGAEALVRWQHPQKGLIGPARFIGLAEKTGLIIDIGEWVLQMASLQLAAWARAPETAEWTLAVNVSARQLRQDDFAQRVLAILGRHGASPRRLKLEITESMLLSDVEDTIKKIDILKAEGIGLSLDDFGTGYSSLSYLQRLPLTQLKIDQSFVRDMLRTPHAASIVAAIVQLARSLGLGLVAEGVETPEQWERLRELACDCYQGYLFAAPMPLDELIALAGANTKLT